MNQSIRNLWKRLVFLSLSLFLLLPTQAAELELTDMEAFPLSADDFMSSPSDRGIFLMELPKADVASVYYKDRLLRAGDALPKEALNDLKIVAECFTEQETAVRYYTVADQKTAAMKELKLNIKPKKNSAPTAEDSTFETYRNIQNSGELHGTDPDGDMLTYTILKQPKRGTVELSEDGTFSYMPEKNKVGEDAFTFCVTDSAGNLSEPATVSIVIKRPSDHEAYQDMKNDPDAFEAMWLKDEKLFSGEVVGGHLCFSPETPVTRGEFLIMTMSMVDAEAAENGMTSGFADELSTPTWMQPYIVSALNNGMITGVSSDSGIVFKPAASMTKAETVVMLQNILRLPPADTTPVFADSTEEETVPVWAAEAAAALSQAGLKLEMQGEADVLTRRDAANVLYQVSLLLEDENAPTFLWVS